MTGCSPISPGCANCYAKRMSARLAGRCGYPTENPFTVTLHSNRLEQPLSWRKSSRIFVCSMGDLFHDDVPDDYLVMVMDVIRRGLWEGGGVWPKHTFMILTKRSARMRDFFTRLRWDGNRLGLDIKGAQFTPMIKSGGLFIGVTVESSEQLHRLEDLQHTPATRRFVSVEPMLGPVSLAWYLQQGRWDSSGRPLPSRGLDWVICGGETGPNAREMSPEWAMDLKRQCGESGIPFFLKQMSRKAPIPDFLQGREFPGSG
ncbi:MAG: DUF5131 family protein [Thermodesulfobacteriota bacterium]